MVMYKNEVNRSGGMQGCDSRVQPEESSVINSECDRMREARQRAVLGAVVPRPRHAAPASPHVVHPLLLHEFGQKYSVTSAYQSGIEYLLVDALGRH